MSKFAQTGCDFRCLELFTFSVPRRKFKGSLVHGQTYYKDGIHRTRKESYDIQEIMQEQPPQGKCIVPERPLPNGTHKHELGKKVIKLSRNGTTVSLKRESRGTDKGLCFQIEPNRYEPGPTSKKVRTRNTDTAMACLYAEYNVQVQRRAERVYTYAHWVPSSNKLVWPGLLAEAGFYFTGQNHEVRCFKCNVTSSIENWDTNDNPKQMHAKLNPLCLFVLSGFDDQSVMTEKVSKSNEKPSTISDRNNEERNYTTCVAQNTGNETKSNAQANNLQTDGFVTTGLRNESRNEILQSPSVADSFGSQYAASATNLCSPEFRYPDFKTYSSRLSTFSNWIYTEKQKPEILSKAGFFFTGESDIVRCFCCDLGLAEWDPKDDPWVEHGRHSPECRFLRTEKGVKFVEDIQLKWRKIYNPKHSAFDDKVSRIETFVSWRVDIEQTPEILAEAGFFFTGDEDVVRCHYCDGGLRNWEPGDDPWEEHTRWFPFCKYVIKMKGREYIEQIRLQTQERERTVQTQQDSEENQGPMNLIVSKLREFEFSNENIQYGITEFKKRNGIKKMTVEAVTDIIVQKQSEGANSPFLAKNVKEEEPVERDPSKLLETNKKLKEQFLCSRCKTIESCILFVNCGHRVTCELCSEQMDYCPQCDVKIKKRMKTFIA